MPETMKLLGTTKSRVTKDTNGENLPHLETTEAVLVHCNIVNNDHQQDSRILHMFLINTFVNYYITHSKALCF